VKRRHEERASMILAVFHTRVRGIPMASVRLSSLWCVRGRSGAPQEQLRAEEGPKTNIECYFNPSTITIDKQVPWQEHKNSEDDLPSLEFTSGAAKLLNVELLFDMFEARGDVYETYDTTGDVRRREDLAGLVALACQRFGRLDVLVSNAGIGPISPLDDLRVDDWEAMIDVNIKGVLYGIAAALPVFRTQGFGHFVNVASTAGLRVFPNMAVYGATKLAVRAISEGLRVEAGDKLRVTIVSPGFVHTSFAEASPNAEVRAQIAASRDKLAIPPEAIARAIAFAIEQPAEVDVNEIVVRPTAQS
jgi:NADP-dependent 3-hydroxy acid dehydrogenase YdfG